MKIYLKSVSDIYMLIISQKVYVTDVEDKPKQLFVSHMCSADIYENLQERVSY